MTNVPMADKCQKLNFKISGTFPGSRPQNNLHQRSEFRRFLLHMFPEVYRQDRRLLLPQTIRNVSVIDPTPRGAKQLPSFRIQVVAVLCTS